MLVGALVGPSVGTLVGWLVGDDVGVYRVDVRVSVVAPE
jgi:hypothetical protein